MEIKGITVMKMEGTIEEAVNRELQLRRLSKEKAAEFLEKAMNRELWNFQVTGVYEAQRYSLGEGIRIGVINSGADVEHLEIASKIRGKFNYVKQDHDSYSNITQKSYYSPYDVRDENGHGTHIASIIAGGLIGVVPESWLYIIKVADEKGSFNQSRIKEAIERCVEIFNVDLINLSLGTIQYTKDLEEACKKAYEKRIILVAAAGNNRTGVLYPAFYEGVISVGATDRSNKTTWFSNIWPTTDIVAPGEGVFGAHIPGIEGDYETAYALGDGTSMAAAHVTGILALALSYSRKKGKELEPEELIRIMKETAFMPEISEEEIGHLIKTMGFDLINRNPNHGEFLRYVYGGGIIRADKIIRRLL